MGRGRTTLLLLGVLVALGAYIYFVESKKPAASETETTRQKVFSVESGKIDELRVTSSTGEVTALRKSGDRWQVTSPIDARADEAEVSGITSNLSSLETQRVVDEQPKSLADYGLDRPRVDVAFKTAGEKDYHHLLLGTKTPTGGDLYARRGDQPRVFLVSGFLDSTFDRKTFDLRDKAVLAVDREKVDAMEVRSAAATLRFEKSGDTWRLSQPVAARADFGAVEGLLGRIASGQMKSIADPDGADLGKYGLQKPEYTVTLSAGSARSTFLVGGKSPDGQYYAKDGSRPMVFTVESFLVEDLKKGGGDFRPKDLFEFRTFTGSRFELARGGAATVFEKRKGKKADEPEKWVQAQPATTADETKILDALSKLTNLRADSFVDALPAGATQAAQASGRYAEGKKQDVVTFFKASDGVYATRAGDPGAMKVPTGEFDDAMKAFDAVK